MVSEQELFGRFSVLTDDSGFGEYTKQGGHATSWRITLNGRDVKRVVTADTAKGTILVHEFDGDGRVFIRGESIAQKTLHGYIQVFVAECSG